MSNIVGVFPEPESALSAASSLKGAGFGELEVMSPIPLEGAEEVLGEKKSVIKKFSLFGAIFGGISGSSVSDTASVGAVLIPEMTKKGYTTEFSSGITVASQPSHSTSMSFSTVSSGSFFNM